MIHKRKKKELFRDVFLGMYSRKKEIIVVGVVVSLVWVHGCSNGMGSGYSSGWSPGCSPLGKFTLKSFLKNKV